MAVNAGQIELHHANIEILTAAQKQADQNYDRKVALNYGGQDRTMTNNEISAEIDREYDAIRRAAGQ